MKVPSRYSKSLANQLSIGSFVPQLAQQALRNNPTLAAAVMRAAIDICIAEKTFFGQNGIRDGHCYSEAILGLIALEEGQEGLNRYLETLKTINSSGEADIIKLKEAIAGLHYHLNDEYGLKAGDLKYSLENIVDNLKHYSDSRSFKLGTPNHAMAIKIIKGAGGGLEYFFLDFNNSDASKALIIKATTLQEFRSKLTDYFTKDRLASYQLNYNHPLLEFKQMNIIGLVKNIPIKVLIDNEECYLSGEQLSTTSDVKKLISQMKKNARESIGIINLLKKENITDFYLELPQQLQASTEKLFNQHQSLVSPQDHIIDFKNITKENGVYILPILNIKDPTKPPVYILSPDPNFNKATEFIKKSTEVIKRNFKKFTSQFEVKHATLAMNTAFALQHFIRWYYDPGKRENNKENAASPLSKGLGLALNAHSYLNLAQLGHGVIQEGMEVGQLLEALNKGLSGTTQLTSSLFKNFGRLGMGLNFAMIGLDATEFFTTQDKYQKAVYGTQFSFDVATTLAGFICGPLTVPLTGLAIGAQGLVESYNGLRKRWEKVGNYFDQVDQAYKKGYEYNTNTDTLKFLDGGVIKGLDLTKENDQIEFGTQYLYTAPSNSFRYITIFDDAGNDDGTKENAIPIRNAMGGNSSFSIDKNSLKAKGIILPTTPIAYLAWHREMVLSLRKCHGAGFQVINRIQEYSKKHPQHGRIFQNENTSFIPLYEKYVDEIFPAAELTRIDIILDNQERILMMSEGADTPWRRSRYASVRNEDYKKNLLNYHLTGNGGKYIISLNTQGSLKLSAKTNGTKWVVDARKLQNEVLKIETNKLTIGAITIHMDPNNLNNSQLQIIKNDETLEIDLKNNSSRTISADGALWNQNHKQTIDAYLSQEAQGNHLLGQKYIPITNYDHNKDIWPEGQAYYDVEQKRVLFSLNSSYNNVNMVYARILQNGKLGAVLGEDVYFYHNYDSTHKDNVDKASYIWKVDAKSGKLKDFYIIPTPANQDKMQMWQEGGQVFISREGIGQNNESVFILERNKPIQLVSYQQAVDNVSQLTVFQ